MNDHPGPEQIEELRCDLLALRDEAQSQIAGNPDSTEPMGTDDTSGRVAHMDAIQRHEMAAAERRRLENRLRLVEKALQRLRDGEYGFCVRCEGEIGFGRLKARPECPVCIRCQAQIESQR